MEVTNNLILTSSGCLARFVHQSEHLQAVPSVGHVDVVVVIHSHEVSRLAGGVAGHLRCLLGSVGCRSLHVALVEDDETQRAVGNVDLVALDADAIAVG